MSQMLKIIRYYIISLALSILFILFILLPLLVYANKAGGGPAWAPLFLALGVIGMINSRYAKYILTFGMMTEEDARYISFIMSLAAFAAAAYFFFFG